MIRPGQLAEFRANRHVRLGIARDGDIVIVREYHEVCSVGGTSELDESRIQRVTLCDRDLALTAVELK